MTLFLCVVFSFDSVLHWFIRSDQSRITMSSTNTIVDFTSAVQIASNHHAPSSSFSSTTSSSSTSSSENNDFEIQANPDSELPFHSKKQLIQFRPTHHDIFHSSNFNGPSFKQIIFAFVMLVSVTSLCSYLYKDSLVNVLLILETLPWWRTSLFFCVLFTLVSLPFAWGKNADRTQTSSPRLLLLLLPFQDIFSSISLVGFSTDWSTVWSFSLSTLQSDCLSPSSFAGLSSDTTIGWLKTSKQRSSAVKLFKL